MSELQASLPATLVSSAPSVTAKRVAPAAVHLCLVVSPCAHRAQLFARAARRQHWDTILCRDALDAARQLVRHRIQLALVDLQATTSINERPYRALVETLAANNGSMIADNNANTTGPDRPLVALCGKQGDAREEIWSRSLGVWMYLPGVDSQTDIALLCKEAKNVAEKLWGGMATHGRPKLPIGKVDR